MMTGTSLNSQDRLGRLNEANELLNNHHRLAAKMEDEAAILPASSYEPLLGGSETPRPRAEQVPAQVAR